MTIDPWGKMAIDRCDRITSNEKPSPREKNARKVAKVGITNRKTGRFRRKGSFGRTK